MLVLVGLAITDIVRNLLDVYLTQRFIIRWRVWLTNRLTGDWLDGDAYYRGRFVDAPIDNPDQRIQQDIDIFTTDTGPETNTPTVGTSQTLLFGTVFAIFNVVSFTPILWGLAGPLTVFGVTVPRALFWLALVYVFFTTIVAFWIGRPLIRLSFLNEMTNAAFRYALVRLRDAGEAVGLYKGAGAERGELMTRFTAIIANYRAIRAQGGGVPRLEQVDERRSSIRSRPSCRHPGCSTARFSSATSPSRRARSTRCRARCRSSAPSTTRSRATGRSSSAWTD